MMQAAEDVLLEQALALDRRLFATMQWYEEPSQHQFVELQRHQQYQQYQQQFSSSSSRHRRRLQCGPPARERPSRRSTSRFR